jgi:hypothetical protein
MQNELTEIVDFIKQSHVDDAIPNMEISLDLAIGYQQRVGELLNEAIEDYEKGYMNKLDDLSKLDDETETTRKAKLNGWLAPKKRLVADLKTAHGSLKSIQMTLLQAIKTRRTEMEMARK